MKKKISIVLFIMVTIGCLVLGVRTRKQNAISIMQMQTNEEESLSYLIETKENQLVMIDGGSKEDAQHLEEVLLEKGGCVESWFVTIAHPQNFGALQRIIENNRVQINHIYTSFNPGEWYEKYEPDRFPEIAAFFEVIYDEEMISKTQDIPNRFETLVDNIYITALNVKNPDYHEAYAGFNQSMILKISNTYKSMIFMGNVASEAVEHFKIDNVDEIHCDAVQVSNNQQQMIAEEVYQKMRPDYLFMPVAKKGDREKANRYLETIKELVGAKASYLSCDGDITIKIW